MAAIRLFPKSQSLTHCINLLVGAANHKQMLFVLVWIELNTVRCLLVRESSDTFSRLCVPELDISIVASTEKLRPIIVETDIANCLEMTKR